MGTSLNITSSMFLMKTLVQARHLSGLSIFTVVYPLPSKQNRGLHLNEFIYVSESRQDFRNLAGLLLDDYYTKFSLLNFYINGTINPLFVSASCTFWSYFFGQLSTTTNLIVSGTVLKLHKELIS